MLGEKENEKTLKRTQGKRTSNTTQFTEKSKMQFPCGCCHSKHPMTHLEQIQQKQGGVSHCGLSIYIKSYLKAKKKNYRNSNISPCKNIIFKQNHLKETKILQDMGTLQLISSFNTSQNIIFQESSCKK
jgi:hypothetical protein